MLQRMFAKLVGRGKQVVARPAPQPKARLWVGELESRVVPTVIGDFWLVFTTEPVQGVKDVVAGYYQGQANLVNGVQDAGVGIANLPATVYNNTAGNVGGGTIGYILSPDWSKDLIVQNDPNHGLGKFLGGNGAVFIITAGVSSTGQAGELVHLTSQEAAIAIRAEGVLNGSGGVFAASRVYSSGTANTAATLVSDVGGQVSITGQAATLFSPSTVVGPISGWTRTFAGAYYAPYTSINLATGEAAAVSIWARWPVLIDAAPGQGLLTAGEVGSGVVTP